MTQKDLARKLGISESAVSRYKRKGMPVHAGAAACLTWRSSNVTPYTRCDPLPRQPPEPVEEPVVNNPMDAEPASICVVEILVIAVALGMQAHARLEAGSPLGNLELPLRLALRAVPLDRRPEVSMSTPVWDALCADAIPKLEAITTPEDYKASAEASGEDLADCSDFWYQIACGEIQIELPSA